MDLRLAGTEKKGLLTRLGRAVDPMYELKFGNATIVEERCKETSVDRLGQICKTVTLESARDR